MTTSTMDFFARITIDTRWDDQRTDEFWVHELYPWPPNGPVGEALIAEHFTMISSKDLLDEIVGGSEVAVQENTVYQILIKGKLRFFTCGDYDLEHDEEVDFCQTSWRSDPSPEVGF